MIFALFDPDRHNARIHFRRVCQRRAAFTTMDGDRLALKKKRFNRLMVKM